MGEPFPRELHMRLKHMIVSHHGTYEFGSPKLPMTLEAMALHLPGQPRRQDPRLHPRDPRRSQPRIELDAVPAEPRPTALQGERPAAEPVTTASSDGGTPRARGVGIGGRLAVGWNHAHL